MQEAKKSKLIRLLNRFTYLWGAEVPKKQRAWDHQSKRVFSVQDYKPKSSQSSHCLTEDSRCIWLRALAFIHSHHSSLTDTNDVCTLNRVVSYIPSKSFVRMMKIFFLTLSYDGGCTWSPGIAFSLNAKCCEGDPYHNLYRKC